MLCLRIRLGERLDYLALRQTLSDTSIVSLPLFDARINIGWGDSEVKVPVPIRSMERFLIVSLLYNIE